MDRKFVRARRNVYLTGAECVDNIPATETGASGNDAANEDNASSNAAVHTVDKPEFSCRVGVVLDDDECDADNPAGDKFKARTTLRKF